MTTLEPNKNSRYIVLDALGILAHNLGPITARRLKAGGIRHFNANGRSSAVRDLPQTRDASRVLAAMRSYWNEAFEPQFEYGESRRVRQLVAQVIDIRNTYEGHPVGDYRYADEALVDIRRLLEAFSAVEGVQQVDGLKRELAQLMLNDSSAAPPAPQDFVPPAAPAASVGQAHRTKEAETRSDTGLVERVQRRLRPSAAPATETRSDAGLVEKAIRQTLVSGCILLTPGAGYPPRNQQKFAVTAISDTGIKIDKLGQEIRCDVLERVVSNVRNAGGEVPVGSKQGWADPGTLERFLQDARGNNTRTSTYAAPILVECGVAEYVPAPGAKRIRLLPPFTGD